MNSTRIVNYRLTIQQPGAALVARVYCTPALKLHLYYRWGKRPTLEEYTDIKEIDCAIENGYFIFQSKADVTSYYLGILLTEETLMNLETISADVDNGTALYVRMETFATACLFLDEKTEFWMDQGCEVLYD